MCPERGMDMRQRKTEFRFFDITEHEKEQEYLRKRHQEGWRFVKVWLPGLFRFEACQPEDVVYQLDYNPDGVAHHAEYVQMFEDCGWEYLQDLMGYSYFRKPVARMQEKEEIFCDEESRLEMIRRVYKGRMIPLLVIFFCVILPQLFLQFSLDHDANRTLAIIFFVLMVFYLWIFIKFAVHYVRLKGRVR